MTKNMEQLYNYYTNYMVYDEETKNKLQALARARLAIAGELEQSFDEKTNALLDVIAGLEGESEEIRSRALFAVALEAGMELGRLQVS